MSSIKQKSYNTSKDIKNPQSIFKPDKDYLEQEYLTTRYLKFLSKEELNNRHLKTIECLSLYQEPKDKDFYDYLYRKKIHIEKELAIQNIKTPTISEYTSSKGESVLTRYSKKPYIEDAYYYGKLRFTLTSGYNNSNLNEAQKDDELGKSIYLSNMLGNGKPINGYVKLTNRLINDQYTLCMSLEYNEEIAKKLGSDACIKIRNKEVFKKRIQNATWENFGICDCIIDYYDPYEITDDLGFPLFVKDYIFSYQKETRILLPPISTHLIKELGPTLDIKIGSLEDIAEIIYL